MILVGNDFETNGPDPKLCDITEASWAFYDTEFGNVPVISRVFLNSSVTQMDPEAEKVTGISLERCQKYGIPREVISKIFAEDLEKYGCDFLVAHNANEFDRVIFERLLPEHRFDWIDTMEDLPAETYQKLGTRTLEFMAARSGFLNPFPHSALPDVQTMMKILFMEDVEEVALRSKVPTVTIQARVSFQEKDLAKARGYRWENIRGKVYPKKWVKRLKKDEVDLEKEEAPFEIAVID